MGVTSVHDRFFQAVLVKAAPIELLNPVKLVHQLRFVGTTLFALFAVDFAGSCLNRGNADVSVERGSEKLA